MSLKVQQQRKVRAYRKASSLCIECGAFSLAYRCHSCSLRHRGSANSAKGYSKFKITDIEYRSLLLDQEELCAICKKSMEKPFVDHNRATGAIRGLLCLHCNTLLGYAKDNVETLTSAILYLEKARY